MTLEYPCILETLLKLFQKQYNSLIKKVFLMGKKGKELKGGSSAPNNHPPYGHEEVIKENYKRI